MSDPRDIYLRYLRSCPGSNIALTRTDGEKYPDDVDGKPSKDWKLYREVTDDKPTKSNVTCMREPEINVGGYLISHFEGGGYWITGPDGDGMQTTTKFEKLIADFFREEM